jgi:anaerobic selenocysteine-containing dehydrogenase
MLLKLLKSINIKFFNKDNITLYFSIIALCVSLIALIQPVKDLTDRKNRRKLTIELSKREALETYANHIENVFIDKARKTIFYFLRIMGNDYIINNLDKIKYIYYTAILSELVNESYFEFFERNELNEIYNHIFKYNESDLYRFAYMIYSPNYIINYTENLIEYYVEIDKKNIDFIISDFYADNNTKVEYIIKLFDEIRSRYFECNKRIRNIYDHEMIKGNLDEQFITIYYQLITNRVYKHSNYLTVAPE